MVLSGVFVCYDQKLKPSGTSKSLKLIYTYNIILYLNTLFVFVKIEKKRIYNGQVDNGLRLMPYIMYIYILFKEGRNVELLYCCTRKNANTETSTWCGALTNHENQESLSVIIIS